MLELPNTGVSGAPPEAAEEAAETIQVSAETIGTAKVGDTITFTVQSIDPKSGTATLAPEESGEAEDTGDNTNPEPSTISKAAGMFDEGGE